MTRVRHASLIEGARGATGTAVIIDVFRAFSTAAFCIGAGAREIVLVGRPEEAFAIRRDDPSVFLTGEVDGRPIDGFDAGNSPSQIVGLDLAGRRVVQRSSSGTQGVVAASGAEEIVLGSFVIARATCRYVVSRDRAVTLVAMGDRGEEPNPEDESCSSHMQALLSDQPSDASALIAALPQWRNERWPWWFPRRDAELACEVDRFDFALPVTREGGLHVARPVRP
ncbi:MAG TPA: 2-phosphosulfolactate phosphatase [Candidatus Limnocylindria bacterium]|nr:2-phosphosulfolactate phosphatase [Candidatus Limnocylindria bacterium]